MLKKIIPIVFIMLVLCSCSSFSSGTASSPEEAVTEKIREKYNIETTVVSVKENKGMQAFDESYYQGTVEINDTGEEFNYTLGKSSGTLRDDYPRLIYAEDIENMIQEETEGMTDCSFEVVYYPSEGSYTRKDQLADYLRESQTYAEIRFCKVYDFDAVYDTATKLEEKGIPFIATVEDYREKPIYLISQGDTKLKPKEEYLQ